MEPKKTVCVDLDGVLANYSKGWQGPDKIGEPLEGAVEFTRRLGKFARVVIFTTRCKADFDDRPQGATPTTLITTVMAWLDKHGFHYDDIYAGQGKPIASAYVDDRAVVCRPEEDLDAYTWAVTAAQRLCNK